MLNDGNALFGFVIVLCAPFLMWLLGQFFDILWSLLEGLFHDRKS